MVLIAQFSILAGLIFFLVAVIGLIRLPDTYTRIHTTSSCDTLGFALIVFGLFIYAGINAATIKVLFLLVFLWMTSPTSASAISKAAFASKVEFIEGSFSQQGRERISENLNEGSVDFGE
jgi:multicomponent Na+:H+ antiporter subunit G